MGENRIKKIYVQQSRRNLTKAARTIPSAVCYSVNVSITICISSIFHALIRIASSQAAVLIVEQISPRNDSKYSAKALKVGDGFEREPAEIGKVVLAFC